MNTQKVNQIWKDTAYIHVGGSVEELQCANYLKDQCALMGLSAQFESFEVDMAAMKKAVLVVDGKEIPCKGYFNCGSHEVEASFYYLHTKDAFALSQCRGKIVMIDGGMGYWRYQDLLENGAVGFITYTGNANYADDDIDQKELRSYVSLGKKIPGVNLNVRDAIALIKNGAKTAKIVVEQDEFKGNSTNVILDLPGEVEETIVLTAHYDTTPLSVGAYDNMSGSIALLGIAEKYAKAPHRYSLRFIWCGSEERGLLGSKAYIAAHEEELSKVILNVNVDMIGSIMGEFLACCTSEEKLVHFIEYFASINGWGINVKQDVYSSDSTPFADKGIPAVSFARMAPGNTANVHTRYDTEEVMSDVQMVKDIEFIASFVEQMVNAKRCPVAREMPDNMKEKLDIYLARKRG